MHFSFLSALRREAWGLEKNPAHGVNPPDGPELIQDHFVMKTRPISKENQPLAQRGQGYYFSGSRDALAGFPQTRGVY